jgi:hypothetical protein
VNVGDWVTYDDEDPADTRFKGEVVSPTQKDLDVAANSFDGGIGPEYGDVLVDWFGDRRWEHPSYLVTLEGPE